jgi:cysteine desulfuration protein SufE
MLTSSTPRIIWPQRFNVQALVLKPSNLVFRAAKALRKVLVSKAMTNTVTDRQENLKLEFERFQDWEARYKHIIELGKTLPVMPPEFHEEKFLVKGCQSRVWLHARIEAAPEAKVRYQADSDAIIVKGLAAVLMQVYDGASPSDIISAKHDFLKDLGFDKGLSPSRANGLFSMQKQIVLYAQAFKALASI